MQHGVQSAEFESDEIPVVQDCEEMRQGDHRKRVWPCPPYDDYRTSIWWELGKHWDLRKSIVQRVKMRF